MGGWRKRTRRRRNFFCKRRDTVGNIGAVGNNPWRGCGQKEHMLHRCVRSCTFNPYHCIMFFSRAGPVFLTTVPCSHARPFLETLLLRTPPCPEEQVVVGIAVTVIYQGNFEKEGYYRLGRLAAGLYRMPPPPSESQDHHVGGIAGLESATELPQVICVREH